MKHFILFTLVLSFFSGISFGQTNDTLIIELTTNDFGDETSWKLFDDSDALVSKRTTFENQTTHFDTVLLDNTKCFYWELHDSFGDGFQGSGSVQEGDFKLYLNGNKFAECNNPAFGSKFTIYNVGSGCATNDIEVTEIALSENIFFGDFYAKVKITNVGGETFNSATCFYKLNDFTSETTEIDLWLEPGKDTIVEYPVSMYLSEAKDAEITFTVVNVNGTADVATENNTATKNVTIHNGFEQIIMNEIFTSSTCAPCAVADPVLKAVLAQHPGEYSLLKHQVSWPAPGDPYYNATYTKPRIDYYGGSFGVPNFLINGVVVTYQNYTNAFFNSLTEKVAPFDIEVSGEVWGDSVIIDFTITAAEDIPSENDYTIQTTIVERETKKNKGGNGQTEFSHVVMKTLPDSEGFAVAAMAAFETKTYSFKTDMNDTFVEQMKDLKGVVFIQDDATQAVVQSKMKALEFLGAAPNIEFSFEENAELGIHDTIIITSDQPIRNINDSEITDFSNVIELYVSNNKATSVGFIASINNEKNEIVVVPEQELDYETGYTITINNVENDIDIAINKIETMFTTVAEPVGVRSHRSNLNIYPNPATEVLNIENEIYKYVQVFDMTGNSLLFKELKKGINTVSIQKLHQGIYIGVFQGEITSETVKLIVK